MVLNKFIRTNFGEILTRKKVINSWYTFPDKLKH